MTDYIKGGRGKRAPYQTVVIRVPEPLAEVVNEMIQHYRETEEIKPVTGLECENCNTLIPEVVRVLEGAFPIKANNSKTARMAIEKALELMKE